ENGDMEGTPVAIIEAQSAGLPVVSTRHSGILDIVVHNETGFLVDEGDVAAMAEHMCTLLDDPELAKRMGAAGKKRIREHFTMEHHIQTINKALAAVHAKR
ncbi:MAG: glycosyltransferase, partial [Verrucomicrobiota bacterium]